MALRNLNQKINDQTGSSLARRMTLGWTALRAGLNVLAVMTGQQHPAESAIVLAIVVIGDAATGLWKEKGETKKSLPRCEGIKKANARFPSNT
jgi:hypothetical protein